MGEEELQKEEEDVVEEYVEEEKVFDTPPPHLTLPGPPHLHIPHHSSGWRRWSVEVCVRVCGGGVCGGVWQCVGGGRVWLWAGGWWWMVHVWW